MLSVEEQKKYDRQLRLWGVRAQTYLKQSKVLICGLSGVNVEGAKNLVLAGANVILADARPVAAADLEVPLAAPRGSAGRGRE